MKRIAIVGAVVFLTTIVFSGCNEITEQDIVAPSMITLGDCADINYIAWYTLNNTIFNTSFQNAQDRTGGIPLKIFVSLDKQTTSPKFGYTTDIIQDVIGGLIGMREGETKTIGPIPSGIVDGQKFGVGAVFSTQYLAFGLNMTVKVTKYTGDYLSVKWIGMETLGSFTMPQFITNNLESTNESEMVIYPPPYHIWENATSIIGITDDNVIVETTPTKSTSLSDTIKDVQYGEKQMMIFPDVTTASWDDTTITITSEPIVGKDYVFQTPYYTGTINVTIHINNIIGDTINVTVTNDQNSEPQHLDVYRTLTFNKRYTLPRNYDNIPNTYIDYIYGEDIERADSVLIQTLGYQ